MLKPNKVAVIGPLVILLSAAIAFAQGSVMPTTSTKATRYSDIYGNTVILSGGYDTASDDGGRPVSLIAGALGIPDEVFRNAFSFVTPENMGHLNRETAQNNKAQLLSQLSPYGISNSSLDTVTNRYRYPPGSNAIWEHTPATIAAVIEDGTLVGFEILDGGNGYTSEPRIRVRGFGRIAVDVTLSYTSDFTKNGALTAITLR